MPSSWPDASEVRSTFEGRVLTRSAPMIDFRLPLDERAVALEESLVFVAPPTEPVEYDVDVEAEGIGLAPLPRAPAPLPRDPQLSVPGAHWLVPPPAMPERSLVSRAPSGVSFDDAFDDDEAALTLPVIPLARRRSTVDALEAAGDAVLGESTSGRASRFAVALSALFAVLAIKAVGAPPRASADPEPARAVALAETDVAFVPRVVVPAGPSDVVLPAADPVWIIGTRARVAAPVARPLGAPATEPVPMDPRRPVPAPGPLPRAAVARL